jgi:hypothetical protein
MKRFVLFLFAGVSICTVGGDVSGRGFGGGGFRGGFGGGGYRGGFGGGGYRGYSGGYSHSYGGGYGRSYGRGFSSFSGSGRYGGSYSGSRAGESYSGWGGRGTSRSYDHTWNTARGGSISTSGSRGAYEGRYGGVAAGGARDTTLTTAGGRTYSAERQGGFASGPGGRTVGGASGSVDGRYGAGSWQSAFSGNRYTGNMNHYASVYGANGAHSTAYWSSGYMGTHAGYVRSGFGYYGCFHPAWYAAHPGCWAAAGWAAGAAWAAPSYGDVASYCGMSDSAPPDYDYGSGVVYQGDDVYVNGQDAGTVQQYADQATSIASQGQASDPPSTEDWKPLGVFALVQGDEKTSNYIFELAVNKNGIIRGNYYDGVLDTTTDVYGSIDKKSKLAAWTIGKKKDRVFEAGLYNLTQAECPCLLHVGSQSTSQMLLVRMQQPSSSGSQPGQP